MWCMGSASISSGATNRTSVLSSETAREPPVTRAVKQTLNCRRTSPSLYSMMCRGSVYVPTSPVISTSRPVSS